MKESVFDWIDRHEKKMVSFLQKVVQEKSVFQKEASAQAVVLEKCRELGLTIDLWEPELSALTSHPEFVSTRNDFKGSPNLVATLKGTGGGKSIILNGHIDVVPEGERNQWEDDPYLGIIKDGKLFGRGATDMKGGNVALLFAMEAIKRSGLKLKGDVIFQSVVDEECGGAGTLAAIMRGYKADAAIIPEPTNMKIFLKQQGSMWFRIKVKGRSAHGGTRYEGVSAIDKAVKVIEQIHKLEEKRNARITDPLYERIPIPVPINIGKMEGGNWPSSVPDSVILEGRCGIAPNERKEDVQAEFITFIKELEQEDSWFEDHPLQIEWFGARWLPNEMDQDHPFLQQLINSFKEVIGKEPTIEASPWGTDGGLLSHAGGIPTIVFGPGQTEMAHFPNEYIDLRKMIETSKVIASLLIDWCEMSTEGGE
nr:peptidase [Bacillus sp. FJAT-47783]